MAQHGPRDTETVLDSRYTLTDKDIAATGGTTALNLAQLRISDDGHDEPAIWHGDLNDHDVTLVLPWSRSPLAFEALRQLLDERAGAAAMVAHLHLESAALDAVRALHEEWGTTEVEELDLLDLWERMKIALGGSDGS